MSAKASKQATGQALHDLFREVFALHGTLTAVMDEVHEQAGLSSPQIRVMRFLSQSGSATVPDVAFALGVSRQFIQKVCNDLHALGFMDFSDNPRHKRSKLVGLSPLGLKAFLKAQQKEESIIKHALPGISSKKVQEARILLATIRKKVSGLDRLLPKPESL
ncbi:MAG: MarR family transcriptional regulator [Thermodesulfobacteriota bacterium]|nr:MarR family transcriptional regulator [Thermodesulfobacteriota bacterium]